MSYENKRQPTFKTWLRINKQEAVALGNGLFQNRRVRKLQIQEALNSPNRYSF